MGLDRVLSNFIDKLFVYGQLIWCGCSSQIQCPPLGPKDSNSPTSESTDRDSQSGLIPAI